MFPISRDPPEGGTGGWEPWGEGWILLKFPISRDPPEGGTWRKTCLVALCSTFPISRDPPEGGTLTRLDRAQEQGAFPISRDPPEGGTGGGVQLHGSSQHCCFQFLGIPPKGERRLDQESRVRIAKVSNF